MSSCVRHVRAALFALSVFLHTCQPVSGGPSPVFSLVTDLPENGSDDVLSLARNLYITDNVSTKIEQTAVTNISIGATDSDGLSCAVFSSRSAGFFGIDYRSRLWFIGANGSSSVVRTLPPSFGCNEACCNMGLFEGPESGAYIALNHNDSGTFVFVIRSGTLHDDVYSVGSAIPDFNAPLTNGAMDGNGVLVAFYRVDVRMSTAHQTWSLRITLAEAGVTESATMVSTKLENWRLLGADPHSGVLFGFRQDGKSQDHLRLSLFVVADGVADAPTAPTPRLLREFNNSGFEQDALGVAFGASNMMFVKMQGAWHARSRNVSYSILDQESGEELMAVRATKAKVGGGVWQYDGPKLGNWFGWPAPPLN